VLDGSRLVGMLSQRDLYFVESLANDKPEAILVEEAMSQDVFEAPVTSRLADVVSTMLAKKYGCAVVTDAGKVVGVFSTIDALRALLKRL
jgi:acetoin utilization protein AcuB